MTTIPVPIWRVRETAGELPRYATPGAAGCDLEAEIAEPLTIPPRGRVLVPTGLAMALPEGYEGQVRPRSGLAARHGVTVVNAPGTIDSDYRGEILVALVNLGEQPHTVQPRDRIAQLVVAPVARVAWTEVSRTDADARHATARGEGGFGHTGRGSAAEGPASGGEKGRRG